MLQFALNGLSAGSVVALTAVSFVIAYRTGGFFNFAHAGLITAGAYSFYFLKSQAGLPAAVAAALFYLVPVAVGGLLERAVHKPLRLRYAKSTGLLLASLGTYTLIHNSVALIFGDDTRSFRWWPIQEGWSLGDLRLTPVQAATAAAAWTAIGITGLFLRSSDAGRRIRAVGISPGLAEVVGIDIEAARFSAILLASALAGLSGFLIACDVDMNPTMGIQPFMTAVVAVLLGRVHLVWSVLAALALSLLQNVILFWLSSSWQDVFTFSVLLAFFLFRSRWNLQGGA